MLVDLQIYRCLWCRSQCRNDKQSNILLLQKYYLSSRLTDKNTIHMHRNKSIVNIFLEKVIKWYCFRPPRNIFMTISILFYFFQFSLQTNSFQSLPLVHVVNIFCFVILQDILKSPLDNRRKYLQFKQTTEKCLQKKNKK